MGKRTRRYEVQFTACLLTCGPYPGDIENTGFSPSASEWETRKKYQADVMKWWRDWHAGTDTPTQKSQFKFYRRFRTWQKVFLRRQAYDV